VNRSSRIPQGPHIADARSRKELGRLLQQSLDEIDYKVGRQAQSVNSVLRLVASEKQQAMQASQAPLSGELAQFGNQQAGRVR